MITTIFGKFVITVVIVKVFGTCFYAIKVKDELSQEGDFT